MYHWLGDFSFQHKTMTSSRSVTVWAKRNSSTHTAEPLSRVKIFRSGITRRELGISPGHNGIIEKPRQPHSITRLKKLLPGHKEASSGFHRFYSGSLEGPSKGIRRQGEGFYRLSRDPEGPSKGIRRQGEGFYRLSRDPEYQKMFTTTFVTS